jgi:hypothetical protein
MVTALSRHRHGVVLYIGSTYTHPFVEGHMGTAENAARPKTKPRPYRCFLLRCWLEEGLGPDGQPGWRFTVQQAGRDTPRRLFASLNDVATYIDADIAGCTELAAD